MSPPRTDADWQSLCRSGMPPTWKLLAERSGGSVWQDGAVQAAVIPAAPDRSVFNSVFYGGESERLIASLGEIAATYDDAGVHAWTVWVPEADTETEKALEEAGHKLDAKPHDMGMQLSDLSEPEPDPELELVEREDYASMARLNEVAYGYPPGDFAAVAEATMPGLRIYFGRLDGEDVATLSIWPHGSDAVVIWVAAVPEARGRGISSRLLAHALVDAREAGLETTTLQSTKLGSPVYKKLGYRDFGAAHMWEKRSPGRPT